MKVMFSCKARSVVGIEHRVLPGGSGWPGRSACSKSTGFLALGANDQVLVKLGWFSDFLQGQCGPKDAIDCEAASAPRPARPSRQHHSPLATKYPPVSVDNLLRDHT